MPANTIIFTCTVYYSLKHEPHIWKPTRKKGLFQIRWLRGSLTSLRVYPAACIWAPISRKWGLRRKHTSEFWPQVSWELSHPSAALLSFGAGFYPTWDLCECVRLAHADCRIWCPYTREDLLPVCDTLPFPITPYLGELSVSCLWHGRKKKKLVFICSLRK